MRLQRLGLVLVPVVLSGCQLLALQATESASVDPLLELAAVHAEAGRLTHALPLIVRARELAPGAVEPKVALADLLAAQGDDVEARALYLQVWRQSATAAHHFGSFLLTRGEIAQARAVLQSALADVLYPGRFDVLVLRAEAARQAGDYQAALADLAKADRMHRGQAEVAIARIRLHLAQAKYTDALALYRELAHNAQDHPELEVIAREVADLRQKLEILRPRFGS